MYQWGTQACGLAGRTASPDRAHLLLPGRDRFGWGRSDSAADALPHPAADASADAKAKRHANARTNRGSVVERQPGPIRHTDTHAEAKPHADADADAGRYPDPDAGTRVGHPATVPAAARVAASQGSSVPTRRRPRRPTTRSRS